MLPAAVAVGACAGRAAAAASRPDRRPLPGLRVSGGARVAGGARLVPTASTSVGGSCRAAIRNACADFEAALEAQSPALLRHARAKAMSHWPAAITTARWRRSTRRCGRARLCAGAGRARPDAAGDEAGRRGDGSLRGGARRRQLAGRRSPARRGPAVPHGGAGHRLGDARTLQPVAWTAAPPTSARLSCPGQRVSHRELAASSGGAGRQRSRARASAPRYRARSSRTRCAGCDGGPACRAAGLSGGGRAIASRSASIQPLKLTARIAAPAERDARYRMLRRISGRLPRSTGDPR